MTFNPRHFNQRFLMVSECVVSLHLPSRLDVIHVIPVAVCTASSILEFPHPGQYLLTGRVAVGCRRDATFLQVLEGGPVEGHRTQLYVDHWHGRFTHVTSFRYLMTPSLYSLFSRFMI